MEFPVIDYATCLGVLSDFASGVALSEACRSRGIRVSAFRRACEASPELAEAFADAATDFQETLVGALLNVTSDPQYGTTDPKLVNAISANLKWVLEKENPGKFGQKVQVQNDAATTLAEALREAVRRIPRQSVDDGTIVIDAKPLPAPPSALPWGLPGLSPPIQAEPSSDDLPSGAADRRSAAA